MRNLARFERSRPVIQHDPFRTLESLFNDYFDHENQGPQKVRPAANIVEDKDGKFCIELSAPGFDKNDFNVELDGRQLTISARKEESKESEGDQKTYHKEFSSYEIERSFTLGEDLNAESVNAKYENGVLNIYIDRVPEATKASTKKIDIQ